MAGPVDDRFVERVMSGIRRQERRLPLVVVALVASALVLAVPALVMLLARPAFEAGVALALVSLRELIAATSDNPIFWSGVAVALIWLGWLALRAIGGRG